MTMRLTDTNADRSLAIAAILLARAVVIVDQSEAAFVTEFGRPVRLIEQAGLHFKWPHQGVRSFDRRLQLDTPAAREMLTKDKKNLEVAWYASWRIADVERFLRTVRTMPDASARLEDMAASVLAAELGGRELGQLVSVGDRSMLDAMTDRADPGRGRAGGAGIRTGRRGDPPAPAELPRGSPHGGLRADPQRAAAGRRGDACRGREPGAHDPQRRGPRPRGGDRPGRVRRRPDRSARARPRPRGSPTRPTPPIPPSINSSRRWKPTAPPSMPGRRWSSRPIAASCGS